MIDIRQIKDVIPHRYPFLLVDKIVELEEGKKAVGIKNVTINEPFFQGHFPNYPVMPGVLIVEAMAQVGAYIMLSLEGNEGKIGLFTGIDGVRFKREVLPGDTLRMEVEFIKVRRGIGKAKASAYVGDELACSGELMFAIVER
ncbi:3-hydroxyacyl-[acyl-carrier-protein] dehydratase [Peptoclostridium litorale DSM 5388]|uniref:3-hydroxyacyl-[acyl-carrier-protein] dehydratase FabZ n=1 Tax=Peptoclostridium litorale DSM 5388 TaxID=1121324 RepID=A0A069RCG6_PEPLI|nr:3-hydroxyacyl-ACP dehydratase FabZ [Peptoclostridium litorale]KDR94744.1 3-hydroxyacyl-[acyl-carrier-protein] dehydratase FabZ [Peptoclostridium litorale DSM 5388]SIN91727.1 3-hydroxyacyl-[acyl-carrier-protein] dehydratase [Peptoclostridium litorale DSM 5388]